MLLCTAHVETLLAPPTEDKEKVQQLLSENQTLRSQLALPAPVKTETTFSKIYICIIESVYVCHSCISRLL